MTRDWLTGLFCSNNRNLVIYDLEDAYTFVTSRACAESTAIVVINHIHRDSHELLAHIQRFKIHKEIALVISTQEPPDFAEAICTQYGAHAYVHHCKSEDELISLFCQPEAP